MPSYSRAELEDLVEQARRRDVAVCNYGALTCTSLYNALDAHPLTGKSALVVGTQVPWIEAVLVAHSAAPTTVDFVPPKLDHPAMRSLGVPELDAYTGPGFDAIFSYSSLEHDDLGRYTGTAAAALGWGSDADSSSEAGLPARAGRTHSYHPSPPSTCPGPLLQTRSTPTATSSACRNWRA